MNYAEYNAKVPGVSLSEMKRSCGKPMPDSQDALNFGILFDNVVLTPEHVDLGMWRVEDTDFTPTDYALAIRMKDALKADTRRMWDVIQASEKQRIYTNTLHLTNERCEFKLSGKCKFDFDLTPTSGGDLKSTQASTLRAFQDAIEFFDYDMQAAWYMDISGKHRHMIIGVSKVNCKVFAVNIDRSSDHYRNGREKYKALADYYINVLGL